MMKVQLPVSSRLTDDEMQFIREMGIEYLSVTFHPEDTDYDGVTRLQGRLNSYGLQITDGGCNELFKNPSIHLGLQDRDSAIEHYNAFTRVLGKCNIPVGYIAWQPDGILRTEIAPGKHTRGGVSMLADMAEINARPFSHGREYGKEEIWENFSYFLKHALPVCEEANVRMALHPNDPPAPTLMGVHSLIYNTECYRKAFEMANHSQWLGMKLCVGCWLEAGEAFGNLMSDIKEFCKTDRIYSVHFRNVSSPMPVFEEVLCEDGYADMYAIMKQLVCCGYKGVISVDHSFMGIPSLGGRLSSLGYATGYLKGMLHAAQEDHKLSIPKL